MVIDSDRYGVGKEWIIYLRMTNMEMETSRFGAPLA
jgi:hypothetical protein